MNIKSMLFLGLTIVATFNAKAQLDNWRVSLKIFPDTTNKTGCVITNDQLNFTGNLNGRTGWLFSSSTFTNLEDFVIYMGQVDADETYLVFTNPAALEMITNPEPSARIENIEGEIKFRGKIIPILLNPVLNKNASQQMQKAFQFEIENNSLVIPNEGKTKFILQFSPKH
jgi:hypothetical protein